MCDDNPNCKITKIVNGVYDRAKAKYHDEMHEKTTTKIDLLISEGSIKQEDRDNMIRLVCSYCD